MTKHTPTEAIILAGGLGTRLRTVVSDVPKPMAPVRGRPFLEYLMDYWIEQGIQRFILSVGYLAEIIESHFGHWYHGCNIDYVPEKTPLGTGGGLRQVLLKTHWQNPQVILANGDTWYEVNLPQLVTDAMFAKKPVTIALKPMQRNDRYGGVGVDGHGHITQFGLKASTRCLVNGGYYLLDTEAVTGQLRNFPDKFSLEQDFLAAMVKGGNVAASIQDVTFLDIGIPEDYALVPRILKKKRT
ncbi:sugar phosphate nucleotidyltransferase [Candidatus Thiosymbion oneisti]|uniref:sugar phosphate nucleotidyltransferase n=1 Tax=Candidatus Thiosymbion oneisti TaxID=589554 RepID=UPI000B0417F9|nr:sugar phosphate nucleotidyltransferase [Candidatus Thiosymbion oneisti]